jgi:CHAD domain-containing protein
MNQVRDLLLRQLDAASVALRAPRMRDGAVHGVRKDLKRARAGLRLMRKCLGTGGYRRLNLALRDAARPLADVRDARAALNAFASLRSPDGSGGERTFGLCVSRALRDDWRESRECLRGHGTHRTVEEVKRTVGALAAQDLERASVGAAVAKVFRAGSRALAEARRRPSDEHLHELRKQAKYLCHQMEFILEIGGRRVARMRSQSDRLAECLGEDHDLAMLNRRVAQIAAAAGLALDAAMVEPWVRRILRRRALLLRDALALGKRLYARRPAEVRAKIDGAA